MFIFYVYRSLVDRANKWLKSNTKYKLITCEMVEFAKDQKPNEVIYIKRQDEEIATTYIVGLR